MAAKKCIAPDNEGYALFSFRHFLEDQKRLGYQAVSFWGGSPHIFVDCYGYENPAGIKSLMLEAEITPICYRPQAYGYTLCAEKGSLQRRAALDYYRFSAELARKLMAPVMLVGIGGVIRDSDKDRQKELAMDGVRILARECGNQGIRLAVIAGTAESGALLNSIGDMKRFQKDVGNCGIEVAVDADAARREKESIEDWFRAFGKDICHVRTGQRAEAFAQVVEVPGYAGYYECRSSPEAEQPGNAGDSQCGSPIKDEGEGGG